jgi:putative transposase
LLEVVGDWIVFLSDPDEEDANKIRGHDRTGWALGEDTFFGLLEDNLQRAVKSKKAGLKNKSEK